MKSSSTARSAHARGHSEWIASWLWVFKSTEESTGDSTDVPVIVRMSTGVLLGVVRGVLLGVVPDVPDEYGHSTDVRLIVLECYAPAIVVLLSHIWNHIEPSASYYWE